MYQSEKKTYPGTANWEKRPDGELSMYRITGTADTWRVTRWIKKIGNWIVVADNLTHGEALSYFQVRL